MLKEIIYNSFQEKEQKQYSNIISFAPSYICDCRRKIYYKKTNLKPSNPIDKHTQIKFVLGNATHDYIRNIFKDLIIEQEIDKEIIWAELLFKYRLDCIIKRENKYIVEIKSTYFSGWKAIEKAAKIEHILQLYLYLLFEGIDRGILLYVGRDNGYIQEYDFFKKKLDEKYGEILDKKIDNMIELKNKIENKILPDRDFEKKDWQCKYCSYKDFCWKE